MTKFICLTCQRLFDESESRWWKDEQCCARCYDKYERLGDNVMVNGE